MVMCARKTIGFFCLIASLVFADERAYGTSDNENRWNNPEFIPSRTDGKSIRDNDSIQSRFLPFSASFSLSSGGLTNNAHSLSVGGNENGISFSQSTSQSGNSIRNEGSGISASQSNSFSAGLSGISSAESNSFNLNHPTFGENSHANSNSFAFGQSTSEAHGNVVNGQATSAAQSSVGPSYASANSDASSGISDWNKQDERHLRPIWTNGQTNHETGGFINSNTGRPDLHVAKGSRDWWNKLLAEGPIRPDLGQNNNGWQHRRPEVVISETRPSPGTGIQKPWSSDEVGRPSRHRESGGSNPTEGFNAGTWSENKPALQISAVSASSSATSNGSGSSAQGHSESHSSFGPNGPFTSTNNRVQSSGNAQSETQGGATSIQQNAHGNVQGSFSSSAIASNSQGNGNSYGNAISSNRGDNSGRVTSQATGHSFVQGTANSGSFNYVAFPGMTQHRQKVPNGFVRITTTTMRNDSRKRKNRTRDPVREIITEFTDTVADLFDY